MMTKIFLGSGKLFVQYNYAHVKDFQFIAVAPLVQLGGESMVSKLHCVTWGVSASPTAGSASMMDSNQKSRRR